MVASRYNVFEWLQTAHGVVQDLQNHFDSKVRIVNKSRDPLSLT
jgi:hypothetical protein